MIFCKSTLYPIPYTLSLCPTPYTLYRIPYTLHPIPYPYTLSLYPIPSERRSQCTLDVSGAAEAAQAERHTNNGEGEVKLDRPHMT